MHVPSHTAGNQVKLDARYVSSCQWKEPEQSRVWLKLVLVCGKDLKLPVRRILDIWVTTGLLSYSHIWRSRW